MDHIIRYADGTIDIDATIARNEEDRRQRLQAYLADLESRWSETPEARRHAAWFAAWHRRMRLLKIAIVIFAVQLAVWFVLAWNGYESAALVVFCSQFITAMVPVYITVWSWKEFLK